MPNYKYREVKNKMEAKKRRRQKFIYRAEITLIFILSATALVIGSAIVSVNCHNIMNSTQMVLFEVEKQDDGITVIFMDREYTFG